MNNKLGGGQQSFGGVLGRLVIELDPKYAFLILTVVDNADIFDVDIVKSQGGGHLGQHAGPVVYVDVEGEHPLPKPPKSSSIIIKRGIQQVLL